MDHRLLSSWRMGGQDSLIQLNEFAEDLRVLEGTPGLSQLVFDMRRKGEFAPAKHTIHMAALFQRGGNPVLRFFPPSNERVPDFEIQIGMQRCAVEAKKVLQSQDSRYFSSIMMPAMMRMKESISNYYFDKEVILVCKDAKDLPFVEEINSDLTAALTMAEGASDGYGEVRKKKFNLFVNPLPRNSSFSHVTSIQILCQRSSAEDQRIERLINKANKQIKAQTGGLYPGVICISVGEHQDPIVVSEYAKRKFGDGQYTNTSGILVHREANYRGFGKHGPVDLIEVLGNPNACQRLGNVRLEGLGVTGSLKEYIKSLGSISCYCACSIEGKVTGRPGGNLLVTPITRLPEESFV